MEVEQIEVREHIRHFAPFDHLSDDWLDRIASSVEVAYYRAGSTIFKFGQEINQIGFVRSGAVEITRRNGAFYSRLAEGELFGQLGLLMNRRVQLPARAIEDSLIYFIDGDLVEELFEADEIVADFLQVEDQARLRAAVSRHEAGNEMLTSRVGKVGLQPPVLADPHTTLQQAARAMTEEQASALVIVENPPAGGGQPRVAGIVTDVDLRARALAEGLALDTPVSEIMTRNLITVSCEDFLFEAMLSMLRHNVHHLPVLDGGRPVAMLELPDIIRYESRSTLYLSRQVFQKDSVDELAALMPDVRASFVRMVNEDANSHMLGSAMASLGRALTQRLLELAEQELGPPPVPYCFLALGSMARDEQFLVTDQDNALVLDDAFDPQAHDAYFLALATRVSDGLATCGYSYCKGGIMATNPRWRQPLRVFRQYFCDWIDRPDPQALLDSSIFFDLDGVHGRTDFAASLQKLVARRAKASPRFLAYLARNACNRTPPLGFFRTFVMEKDGKQNNSINLKRRGTAPLTDVIRVHALAAGSTRQNSFNRLKDIARSDSLGPTSGDDLRDALEFLSIVRARHQALDVEAGRDPDNNVEPENLSPFERRSLRDAFDILSKAQNFLKFRYRVGASR